MTTGPIFGFKDRRGRQRWAVLSFDGRDYRILDEAGRYCWSASPLLVWRMDGVRLPGLECELCAAQAPDVRVTRTAAGHWECEGCQAAAREDDERNEWARRLDAQDAARARADFARKVDAAWKRTGVQR